MKVRQSPTCLFPISQVQLQAESGHGAPILRPTGRSGQPEENPIRSVVIGKSNGQRSETAESHAAAISEGAIIRIPVSVLGPSPWEQLETRSWRVWQRVPAGADVGPQTQSSGGRAELTPSASLSLLIPLLTWGGVPSLPLQSFYLLMLFPY